MIIKIGEYKGKYRIVSLAFCEQVRDDLLNDELDTLYISEKSIVLYPDNILLSDDIEIINKFHSANNYDVYELLEDGRFIECYDDSSLDNYFFVTAKCNSNCIMCPSPEVLRRKEESCNIDNLIEIAKHIPSDASHLTVTGGEPFMAGKEIFRFIAFLRDKFKCTEFLFLTNGRIFSVDSYAQELRKTIPTDSILAIPVHGSSSVIHDQITQTKDSFIQTITGIKKLLRLGIRIELRIVINKFNSDDFENIVKLIINEIPEIEYVTVIAMEMTGNAYVNRDKVWITYSDVASKIEKGIIILIKSGIDVKLYNFPLCAVKKKFWTICEKSISPDKVRYTEKCNICTMKKACGGIFAGTILMEKEELKPIL